jgi:hypothetical protein
MTSVDVLQLKSQALNKFAELALVEFTASAAACTAAELAYKEAFKLSNAADAEFRQAIRLELLELDSK